MSAVSVLVTLRRPSLRELPPSCRIKDEHSLKNLQLPVRE